MAEPKRLYRSRKDRMIAGVCGGLGKYFNVDPVLLRIAFVVLTFFSGSGLILYLILAIVVPNEPEAGEKAEKKASIEEGVKDTAEGTKKVAEEVVKSAELATQEVGQPSDWLSDRRNLLGLFVVVIGLVALTNQLFPYFFKWEVFWPIVLILVGVYIIFKGN